MIFKKLWCIQVQLQAHLADIAGSVPEHHNKASITIKQVEIFAGEGSCLQFVKNATAKCSNVSCACIFLWVTVDKEEGDLQET